jgi:hypothetical protein
MTLIDRLIGGGAPVQLSSARPERKNWQNHVYNVRDRIQEIRNQPKLKAFACNQLVVQQVIEDFKRRGDFYQDGSASYVFVRDARVLIRLERGQEPLEVALGMYGLAPTEQIAKQVTEMLRIEARTSGKKTTVYELSHYNRDKNTLNVFDGDCGIYQIEEAGICHVDNGTDGVLFLQSPSREPFSVEGLTIRADGKWRGWLNEGVRFAGGILSAAQQQALLILWVMAMFFRTPTKTILAAIGEKGARKSSLFRKLGQWLLGPQFDVTPLASKPDEFDVAVTNGPFVVADNVDEAPPWFNDKVAVAATGGMVRKRKLYSNNQMVEYPFVASLAVTSRTPTFTRDDVADRTIPLYFERIEDENGSFLAESEILADVQRVRTVMWASLFGDLHRAVCAHGETRGRQYRTHLRMADFATLVFRVADTNGQMDDAKSLIQALADEQVAFARDAADSADTLYPLLDAWLEIDTPVVNLHREVSTATLAEELKQIAVERRVRWSCPNGRALGQYLKSRRGFLQVRYDAVTWEGHAGVRFWRFRKVNGEKGESDSE